MKEALETLVEFCAAAALCSARIRLKERSMVKWGLGSPNDPKALLLVYEQSQWNAWAAVAPGFAALFAILDGLLPNNT
jgi:hypothetical protein